MNNTHNLFLSPCGSYSLEWEKERGEKIVNQFTEKAH